MLRFYTVLECCLCHCSYGGSGGYNSGNSYSGGGGQSQSYGSQDSYGKTTMIITLNIISLASVFLTSHQTFVAIGDSAYSNGPSCIPNY